MPFARSERRRELERPDQQQYHWPGIPKVETAALRLVEQKEHSDGDYDCRAHQALDRATLAMASCLCAHIAASLTLAADAVAQHQYAYADQHDWPEDLSHAEHVKEPKIVQQE